MDLYAYIYSAEMVPLIKVKVINKVKNDPKVLINVSEQWNIRQVFKVFFTVA